MSNRFGFRFLVAIVATQAAIGCSRFVWHEDPFTPDQAPTTEIIASGNDTTYVLRRDSYYLLASQRGALWNRDVIDDVAWRYRALFREAPPTIAIRIDTSVTNRDTATTWRGMPLARVSTQPRPQPIANAKSRKRDADQQVAEDSARARLLTGPLLASSAAETWFGARALDAKRVTNTQPGGSVHTTTATGAVPAWIEAGALRILGTGGAVDRAAMELRADEKAIVPLASLFAVKWQDKPNALDITRAGTRGQVPADEDGDLPFEGPARGRARRDAVPGVSPVFLAQSVSVLAFIQQRDPALVARLTDELARGASVESVLASSTTLPHDVASLDAEWRKWLKKSARRR